MCWKFVVPLTTLVVFSLLLVSMTDASPSFNNCNKGTKASCKINHQMASKVAAEAATSAAAALKAGGEAATQQIRLVLSEHAQQAAAAASDILAGKKNQLEALNKRLAENQKAIDEGNRAIAITIGTMKRVSWIRESTRQGLENMMSMYNESLGTQADVNYLADFAEQEEVEKTKLFTEATRRLDNLKKCMNLAEEDLKSIRQSAIEANNAADEAKQRIDMLRQLVPKIKMLKREDLQTVTDFLLKRRRSPKHISAKNSY
ncbi:uncharacterized protein LOC110181917 [Drosophila serrata]|uniref:uncharacterized protein LOC110181917 n=1 Tax=Drosophila serrata TaxID=7274 RepID=UPI000A1D1A59|nr:uncharacterized protein LOC110181917 [Drosophila serrata]KAH8380935.1 hypothetical protein KR200_000797 [Drosophila serrata]